DLDPFMEASLAQRLSGRTVTVEDVELPVSGARGEAPPAWEHALEDIVAVDEMVLERARGVQGDQGRDRPCGELVSEHSGGEQRRGGRGDARRDVRNDEQVKKPGRHWQRRRRDEKPAGEDRANRERVERALGQRREAPLPARRGRSGRGGAEPARGKPAGGQRERDEAPGFVPLIEVERRRGVESAVDHDPADRKEGEDDRPRRPVERDHPSVPPWGSGLDAQLSVAALEMTSSTSRETSGKPEFMPNASLSMLVFARKARRPPLPSRSTATSTVSGRVTPSRVRSPVTRTVWSSTFAIEFETKSIDGNRSESRKATERR